MSIVPARDELFQKLAVAVVHIDEIHPKAHAVGQPGNLAGEIHRPSVRVLKRKPNVLAVGKGRYRIDVASAHAEIANAHLSPAGRAVKGYIGKIGDSLLLSWHVFKLNRSAVEEWGVRPELCAD